VTRLWVKATGERKTSLSDHELRLEKFCRENDSGMIPLDVPQVKEFLCDTTHRKKCIDSVLYAIRNGMQPSFPSKQEEEQDAERKAKVDEEAGKCSTDTIKKK
jgi:hypothetical protein